MKIAVLADPHSNLTAFKEVLRSLPKVEAIVCAGDLVGYGAEPNEVVDLARSKRMRVVMGNHDYSVATRDVSFLSPPAARAALWTADNLHGDNVKYLRGLPRELKITYGTKSLYVVHGSPRDPLNEYLFPDLPNRMLLELVRDIEVDVIIFGHTHIPMKRVIQGKLVINPGGIGQPRDRDPRASFMILTLDGEVEVRNERVKYDIERASKNIESAGLPSELGTRLYFGW